jgi:glycosyltransferase involved in cell wall biosynthesis
MLKVSVIIPAYNVERYISETIDSILSQTYPNIELVIVDDGSTDRSRDRILSYGTRVRYVYQANSGGCGSPRNHGMAVASGEAFVFIDGDDIMAPDRIADQVRFLTDHPDVALVFSNYQDFDHSGLHSGNHFATCPLLGARVRAMAAGETGLVLNSAESTEMLLTENFGSSSPMVRRSAVEVVGPVDESLKASEDYDFQYRVAARFPIGIIPKVGWYKRLHRASMSSNDANILRHKILTRSRLLARETAAQRRWKLKRTLATCHYDMAVYQTGRNNLLALKHAVRSVALRPRLPARLFARLLFDVLGRDTNGYRGNAV